ncbi:hypothetical protein Q31a_56820 [Aureliella helgolandensis]|uniref:Uncharacterized protein n=1 Tax=Aureliella helgolandensis TaxID=2527968 RepID=A0A518GFC1_9BACT|nr:hypothetical protein Q31a_56820 [Aureliella helgolandensis]
MLLALEYLATNGRLTGKWRQEDGRTERQHSPANCPFTIFQSPSFCPFLFPLRPSGFARNPQAVSVFTQRRKEKKKAANLPHINWGDPPSRRLVDVQHICSRWIFSEKIAAWGLLGLAFVTPGTMQSRLRSWPGLLKTRRCASKDGCCCTATRVLPTRFNSKRY